MRTRIPIVATCVVASLLCAARPALAQDDPKGDLGVSYGVLHDSDLQETFPAGIVLAVAGDIKSFLRGVVEFGAENKTITDPTGKYHLQNLSYMGGLRFVVPREKQSIFVQLLAGGDRASVALVGAAGARVAANGFAVQPGVGVDVPVSDVVSIRFQVDYRAVRSNGTSTNAYRVAFGVVFPFGR